MREKEAREAREKEDAKKKKPRFAVPDDDEKDEDEDDEEHVAELPPTKRGSKIGSSASNLDKGVLSPGPSHPGRLTKKSRSFELQDWDNVVDVPGLMYQRNETSEFFIEWLDKNVGKK